MPKIQIFSNRIEIIGTIHMQLLFYSIFFQRLLDHILYFIHMFGVIKII